MYNYFALLLRLIRHYRQTNPRFGLHSPFIYQFYKNILKDKTRYIEYTKVEHMRTAMLSHPGFIRMTDLGSKSFDIKWNRKIVKACKVADHSAVSPAYGQLLFRMVRYFKPATILELGTSLGISTSYLSTGNPKGKVITIEGCNETSDYARVNFEHLGLRNVRQITGNFDDVLPGLLTELGKVDMVFIDGNHRREPTLKYFFQIIEHFREDSVLIIDDIHWSKEMEEAWEIICNHSRVRVSVDLFRMGIVFFDEGLSKEKFFLRL